MRVILKKFYQRSRNGSDCNNLKRRRGGKRREKRKGNVKKGSMQEKRNSNQSGLIKTQREYSTKEMQENRILHTTSENSMIPQNHENLQDPSQSRDPS
uniref:Uncharacterized protein n=1 Tax=Acrobeloides nanus TaxID=290746 RepID=A0A914DJN0_9BILA